MIQVIPALRAVGVGVSLALSVIANVGQVKTQAEGRAFTTVVTTQGPTAQPLVSRIEVSRRDIDNPSRGTLTGRVVLRLSVRANGQIKDIEVMQKLNNTLDLWAIEKAKLLKFEAWEEATTVTVVVTFNIPQ